MSRLIKILLIHLIQPVSSMTSQTFYKVGGVHIDVNPSLKMMFGRKAECAVSCTQLHNCFGFSYLDKQCVIGDSTGGLKNNTSGDSWDTWMRNPKASGINSIFSTTRKNGEVADFSVRTASTSQRTSEINRIPSTPYGNEETTDISQSSLRPVSIQHNLNIPTSVKKTSCPSDFVYDKKINFCFKVMTGAAPYQYSLKQCAQAASGGRLAIVDVPAKRWSIKTHVAANKISLGWVRVGGTVAAGGQDYIFENGNTLSAQDPGWCSFRPKQSQCLAINTNQEFCFWDSPCRTIQACICEIPV